nr:CD200R1 X8.2 variant [Sus scrofa]
MYSFTFFLQASTITSSTYRKQSTVTPLAEVPPEVTLVQSENGTVVCKAVAGKPAAQISWTPEGDCVTEQNPHGGNGTVTVWSMCYWKARHVPNVSCTVSHVTGNKSLFLELNQENVN